MKNTLRSLSAVILSIVVLIGGAPAMAAASPAGNTAATSSSGLSIPPRRDAVIKPGQTFNDNLVVNNLSQASSLNVGIRVVDFTFLNNSGTPKLSLAANALPTTWSLKPFIKIPSSYAIPAGQSRSIPYSITIPKNQGAGSYYSAVIYSSSPGTNSNVNLNAAGVTLIFVSVPGVVKENMSLERLGAYRTDATEAGGSYQYISTNKSPNEIAYTLKNDGNVAESPSGTIKIKYMFGGSSTTIGDINSNSELALIGQSRLFTTCIARTQKDINFEGVSTPATVCAPTHFKPGYYTISLDAFYGQNGNTTQEITGSTGFWYLPAWFVFAVLGGLLAAVCIIWLLQRKIKKKLYGQPVR